MEFDTKRQCIRLAFVRIILTIVDGVIDQLPGDTLTVCARVLRGDVAASGLVASVDGEP